MNIEHAERLFCESDILAYRGSYPEYMNLHIPKECYANYHGVFIPFDGWGRFGNTIEAAGSELNLPQRLKYALGFQSIRSKIK